MKRICQMIPATAALLAVVLFSPGLSAGEPVKEGGWLHEKNEQTGIRLYTMNMTLHPAGEPRPALKYRLIPDDFDMLEGNAALFYLMAMGYLEQNVAHKRLMEIFERAARQSQEQGKDIHQVAPLSWLSMAPKEMPLDEVKEYLEITSFQPGFLKEACRRGRFDMERNLRTVDNPLSILLPEIQSMRELARMQRLRCKVAIAEGRIDDAIRIVGQQYALARHLGQDDFAVTDLVAFTCAGIGWEDALYLIQHEKTPNLYWAFASLPQPMIDITHSAANERQMLFLQCRTLQEVGESPRPQEYWERFVERLLPELEELRETFRLPETRDDPKQTRDAMAKFIADADPEARRYLLEDCGFKSEQVEAYPAEQAVFLAIVRYYERERDNAFKWAHLPYWQISAGVRRGGAQDGRLIAAPSVRFLTAISVVNTALAHFQQQLALLQAVEAIRMYGAGHDGVLPPSLDSLPVPVPVEPFTGKPLDYEFHGDHAVLTGHEMPSYQCKLVLRFAK